MEGYYDYVKVEGKTVLNDDQTLSSIIFNGDDLKWCVGLYMYQKSKGGERGARSLYASSRKQKDDASFR